MLIRNIALATPDDIRAAIKALPNPENLSPMELDCLDFLLTKTKEWIDTYSIYKDFDETDRKTIAFVYLSWYVEDNGIIFAKPSSN